MPPSRRWQRPSSNWKWRKANQQHYSALIDYASITAPYDGVVTWRFSDTGALVQAGTSNTSGLPVVTVAQVERAAPAHSGARVDCRARSYWRFRRRARAGHRRTLHRQSHALHRLRSIPPPAPCRWKSTFPIPTTTCSPACTPTSRCSANSKPNALTVPVEAIQRDRNKTSVLVVDPQNRVQRARWRSEWKAPITSRLLPDLTRASGSLSATLAAINRARWCSPKASRLHPANAADAE